MSSRYVLSAMCLLLGAAPAPKPADAWAAWVRDLKSRCPGQHVEWMGDGGYDEFLGAFHHTLSPVERRNMERLADYSRLCPHERAGFSCELQINLAAAQRLGLMPKLTSFACQTITCEEPASCSRFPGKTVPPPGVS